MKPFRIRVEYQENAQVLALRHELASTKEKLNALQKRYTALDVKYAQEAVINLELIDLCKRQGIKFRPGLDISKWDK